MIDLFMVLADVLFNPPQEYRAERKALIVWEEHEGYGSTITFNEPKGPIVKWNTGRMMGDDYGYWHLNRLKLHSDLDILWKIRYKNLLVPLSALEGGSDEPIK